MLYRAILLLAVVVLPGCTTGSTLRTARVLEKNQMEISAGVVIAGGGIAPVGIVAYGVTECFELEGRLEDQCLSVTPRLQLLRTEWCGFDALALAEVGYSFDHGFLGGPGILVGRKFGRFSPYLAYKYRMGEVRSWSDGIYQAHIAKLGTRINFDPFWKSRDQYRHQGWFLGLEIGTQSVVRSGTDVEGAANIGFNF